MPAFLKDSFEACDLAVRFSRSICYGDKLQIREILELFERTNGEIFHDRGAFNSLSLAAVEKLAKLDRHFVSEKLLIKAVVNWCENKTESVEDCRRILFRAGFMMALRWGALEQEVLVDRYGYLFTPEELDSMDRWRTGAIAEVTFMNMRAETRGQANVEEDNCIFLTKPPMEVVQVFRNDTLEDMKLLFQQIKICKRIYEFTEDAVLRPEKAYVEVTSSSGDISCGFVRTKPGHSTTFEAISEIGGFVSAGNTVIIKLVLSTVGAFQLAEETECFGFQLSSVTPKIITEIHGIKLPN